MATEKLPLFPLNLVVFPQEKLNLHIFEPRYRQLVGDCLQADTTFGIPAYVDGKVQEFGTEVYIKDVINKYDDGRLDIVTRGMRILKMHTFENPLGAKLYAGGEVSFIEEPEDDASNADKILMIETAARLFELLNVQVPLSVEEDFLSWKVGHKIGLSLSQEYYLLALTSEKQRIKFINEHMSRSIPIIREAERTRERIKMNGHFKHMDPLDF